VSLFPLLLATHITLAVSLFLPSLLLPFVLRPRRAAGRGGAVVPTDPSRLVRTLLWLQGNGTLVIGAGLAVTGVGLVAVLGTQLLSQPWLLVALSIYAANLLVAFFVQRPRLRTLLLRQPPGDEAAEERWRTRARRQRYVSYAMAGAVGLIGFLMSAKPSLW
jgi:hypothetical protein